jgi:hypothetical protein
MAFPYLHSIAGRIRIKIPRVRGCADSAQKLEEQLEAFPGIELVRANPTTGNVLILYAHEEIGQREVLRVLRRLRWIGRRGRRGRDAAGVFDRSHAVGQRAAENVIAVILELAVTRLICI